MNDLLRVFQLGGDDAYKGFVDRYRIILAKRLETKFHKLLSYIIDNSLYNEKIDLFFRDLAMEIGRLISINPFNDKLSGKITNDHYSIREAINVFEELIAKGNKKHLVMLYRETEEGVQKIDPRPGREERLGLLAVMPMAISLLIFILIMAISHNIIISWASSIASSIASMLVLMMGFFEGLRKYDITGRRVYKIDIQIDPSTPRDKIDNSISLLASIDQALPSNVSLTDILSRINDELKVVLRDFVVNIEEYNIPALPGIKTYLAVSNYCNALSIGFFRKAIAISNKMFACMNGVEISAVINHELSHIRNHDSLTLIGMLLAANSAGVGSIFYVLIFLKWQPIYISLFYVAYLLASMIVIKQINKSIELRADREAVRGSERSDGDPYIVKGLLASLIKVGYPNALKEQSTNTKLKNLLLDDHPLIEKRIINIINLLQRSETSS